MTRSGSLGARRRSILSLGLALGACLTGWTLGSSLAEALSGEAEPELTHLLEPAPGAPVPSNPNQPAKETSA